jgi:hypothetical protein
MGAFGNTGLPHMQESSLSHIYKFINLKDYKNKFKLFHFHFSGSVLVRPVNV